MPPHPIFCSQVLINTIHLLREVYSQSNQIQPAEGRDGRKASDCQAQSPRIFSHCWGGLSSTCFYDLELLFEMQVAPVYVKPDTAAIHERIGFDPKPKLQWKRNRLHWKKNKVSLWVEDFLNLSRYLLVAIMWLCSSFTATWAWDRTQSSRGWRQCQAWHTQAPPAFQTIVQDHRSTLN